jgi:hypothetical protein
MLQYTYGPRGEVLDWLLYRQTNSRHELPILNSLKDSNDWSVIEKLYKRAQDIEGVIKDGELYIVQTRPQM